MTTRCLRSIALAACVALGAAACQKKDPGLSTKTSDGPVVAAVPVQDLHKPTAILLPEKYNSPDGMTIGKDGCIYLSMNNAGIDFKFEQPAKILRITPDDQIQEVTDLPKDPKTNVASPLGISFGADGNLYVADNQSFATKEKAASRLYRVNMDGFTAKGVDVVATGFNMSNGVACRGDSVYICETTLDDKSPMTSGVYRIKLDELKGSEPLQLTGINDPHLIVKLQTKNPEHKVGANGLAFDSKGNMYICNFGDREIIKVTFDGDGKVASQSVLAKEGGLQSCDGLQCDSEDNLWVADFLGNAVAKVSTTDGKITIIAKNGPTDGADGGLDAPSECIRRGNKVYVSNIDITYGPNKADSVHNMSVIDLGK